jgi:hypothetical protein
VAKPFLGFGQQAASATVLAGLFARVVAGKSIRQLGSIGTATCV